MRLIFFIVTAVVLVLPLREAGAQDTPPAQGGGDIAPAVSVSPAEASSPAQSQPPRDTAAPLTRLDNKSIEEFLAAHPPQNLKEAPRAVVQEKGFQLTGREGLLAGGVCALAIIIFVVRRLRKASADRRDQKKEEIVKENMQLSEEERNALEEGASKQKTALTEGKYWRYVPRVFVYPFRGHVFFATIAGSVFFFIMSIAMMAPFYGFMVSLMFLCYVVACMVCIIETAVTVEREDVFDWPDFTVWIDWLGKAVLLILAWGICYGPGIAYLTHFQRIDAVFFVLIVTGSFISPMYTLAIALVGGISSLNVINVFKSIGVVFGNYFFTVILLGLTSILQVIVYRLPLTQIPIWGGVFRWVIFVYFLFVNMRLLGIFYKAHRLKLRWYGEDE